MTDKSSPTTTESEGARASEIRRRTLLKTAAWSVPVVAIGIAAPAAAASTEVDLVVRGVSGDSVGAVSPDGVRAYSIPITHGFWLGTVGAAPAPPGSVATLSFDNRILGGPSLTVGGAAATPLGSPSTSGNRTTVRFTIPATIPAGEDSIPGTLDFETMLFGEWHEDIESFSLQILPTGPDPDLTNNGWDVPARYYDACDASVSATWGTAAIPHENGEQFYTFPVLETVTVTALAPGDVPTGGELSVRGPSGVTTGFVVTSATLDGADVSGSLGTPVYDSSAGSYRIPLGLGIPAGQSLVVGLSIGLAATTSEYVSNGGNASFFGQNDRDQGNNYVSAPVLETDHDAEVTATWASSALTDTNGNTNTVRYADTATVRALSGDVPPGGRFTVFPVSDYLQDVSITRARLDGVDVTDKIGPHTINSIGFYDFPVLVGIPEGSVLVLDIAQSMKSQPGQPFPGDGGVNFYASSDRDQSNNSAYPPAV